MEKTVFSDGNPAQGILGTIVTAAFLNAIQNHRHDGGNTDGSCPSNYAADTGAANAYAIALTPAVINIPVGVPIHFMASDANTGASTLAVNGLAPVAIKQPDGTDLPAGAILAGQMVTVMYTGSVFMLVSRSATAASYRQLQSISTSVAANALTVGYAGGTLDFRNAALNGAPITGVSVGALALAVPSGATLGTVNAVTSRLVVLVAYNAGTPVLCITNLSGGLNLDETGLISPTTISSGATSAGVIYSASAVAANSPYRIVGVVDITESTAGIWVTAPTLVQGIGGQALAAMSSIGYGQTWQNLTGSRAIGTTYYNTTGKPILVSIIGCANTTSDLGSTFVVNGITVAMLGNSGGIGTRYTNTILVPPGAAYVQNNGAGTTINFWSEFR